MVGKKYYISHVKSSLFEVLMKILEPIPHNRIVNLVFKRQIVEFVFQGENGVIKGFLKGFRLTFNFNQIKEYFTIQTT